MKTLSLLLVPFLVPTAQAAAPLRVFILAGQSNMQGQGVVDLHHPKYYNGGKGTLEYVMKDKKKAKLFKHIRQGKKWVVRKDVFVRYKTRQGLKAGGLTIGFTGYSGKHHIGPEFQFGHVVGDKNRSPVLLIKTAWGGKSLYKDFRPPSSGGKTGPYYKQMISEIREALASRKKDFPKSDLAERQIELAGFVWFQGWNDMVNEKARQEYQQNLVNLIKDVRRELKSPKLPVVVGELGNLGKKAGKPMQAIRKAQRLATMRPEFRGNVVFVSTTAFARPRLQSPNITHGHHWFGNAESYFLIGDAFGKAMNKLVEKRR